MSEEELDPLLEASDGSTIELSHFDDVSVHAPAERVRFSEGELAERLRKVADRGWAVVVHSDVIEDFSLWRRLGEAVCRSAASSGKVA